MNKWIAIIVCGFLLGCEYSVPLVKTPDREIDKAALGLWERKLDDGKTERLTLLPLDEKEYLVSYTSGGDGMFARACLTRVGEKTLVQIKWLGTTDGELANDDKVYQYAGYAVNKDYLTIFMMNSEIISHDLNSTDALSQAILSNINKPELFKEAIIFSKAEK